MNDIIKKKLIAKKNKALGHVFLGEEARRNMKYARYKKDKRRISYLIRRGERAKLRLQQFANISL